MLEAYLKKCQPPKSISQYKLHSRIILRYLPFQSFQEIAKQPSDIFAMMTSFISWLN